jgi:membrane protease YdiL (CAAX protease family)
VVVILLADFVVKPLSAILVLLWAWRSHTPWREIGYVRPRSWIGGLAIGIVFGVALKLVVKAIVMPLIVADPINHAFHYLVGNTAALPGMLFLFIIGAGFGEETVYRGYLFERLGKLIGTGVGAKAATVLITTALFALGHYSGQGWPGVAQATMTGLTFGTVFAITGRIWMLMCAHAAYDVASLAIIYWDLESAVAHLIFR